VRQRRLGKTGLSVSELALGTWGLSGDGYGPVAEADQDRVIDRARSLGITLFDTADSYARGAMERRLGAHLGSDKRALIATKLGTDLDAAPPRKRFEVTYLREAFERSRERLAREIVDVALLHNPSSVAVDREEATGFLRELKSAGKIRAWGVSAGSIDVARAALARGAEVIELAYNALNPSDLNALGDAIAEHEAGVLAHSVLGYGLLCGHWSLDKEFSEGDHRAERWTVDELRARLRQLDALRPLIGGPVVSMRAGALRFVLENERVSSAVLGPRGTLQLDQLVREAGREPPYLSEDKLRALKNRLQDVGVEL
jgi:aryl-alcohol dehydrogenase-like predicted oxidoreductase